jgi:hypothetical protein
MHGLSEISQYSRFPICLRLPCLSAVHRDSHAACFTCRYDGTSMSMAPSGGRREASKRIMALIFLLSVGGCDLIRPLPSELSVLGRDMSRQRNRQLLTVFTLIYFSPFWLVVHDNRMPSRPYCPFASLRGHDHQMCTSSLGLVPLQVAPAIHRQGTSITDKERFENSAIISSGAGSSTRSSGLPCQTCHAQVQQRCSGQVRDHLPWASVASLTIWMRQAVSSIYEIIRTQKNTTEADMND